MPSRKFHIEPQVANQDFPFLRREVQSDEDGQIRIDGIVPGSVVPSRGGHAPRQGPVAFVGGRPPWFDEVLVLVPKAGK